MFNRTTRKGLAAIAAGGLLLGAYASAPATAAKPKKKRPDCAPASAPEPKGHSSNAAEAVEVPVVKLTAAATQDAPMEVELEHGPALHEPILGAAVQESTEYFNFQVVSKVPYTGVHIRQGWGGPPGDFDLYLYDSAGKEVANSNTPGPVGLAGAGETGGADFESIPGYPAGPCTPYVVESKGFVSPGETVTLKVWVGPVTRDWTAPPPQD